MLETEWHSFGDNRRGEVVNRKCSWGIAIRSVVMVLIGGALAACDGPGFGLVGDGEPAAADIDGSIVQGRFTAQRWCSSCHAVGTESPTLNAGAPAFSAIANRPDVNRGRLLAFMDETHPVYSVGAPIDMPTDVLYEREKADLVAYILSLRESGG